MDDKPRYGYIVLPLSVEKLEECGLISGNCGQLPVLPNQKQGSAFFPDENMNQFEPAWFGAGRFPEFTNNRS